MQTLQQKCNHDFVKAPDNGETVCRRCGEVQKTFSTIHRLPMGVSYQPTSEIVFGKGLGNTLDRYGLLKVLAKGPPGSVDLGVRSRQIRCLVQTVEPPALQRCLGLASKILTKLNFSDNNIEKNVVISNMVGACVRKLYAFLAIAKIPFKSKELVGAAIFFTLKKCGFWPDPSPRMHGEYVETNVLRFHKKYLDVCELLDRKLEGFLS